MALEKTSSTRLGSYTASAVAMSLDKLLEIYKTVAELEQETYKLSQQSTKLMSSMAQKSAEYTHAALADAASSMMAGAAGGITSGALGLGGELKGLHSFTTKTAELKPVQEQLNTIETNKVNLDKGLAVAPEAAVANGGVQAKDANQLKAAVNDKLAKDASISEKEMQDYAASNREDAFKTQKELDARYDRASGKKRSLENEREAEIQKYRGFGRVFGELSNGISQAVGAGKKANESEDEALKVVAQTSQQIARDMSERQGQGISSFDSMRQAIAQAQAEMAGSNRI